MVIPRAQSFLKSSAEGCLQNLRDLRQRAEDGLPSSKRTVSKSKRQLLNGVINDVNDSLRSLKAWVNEFSKADQARNAQVITTATTYFESLSASIGKADGALKLRLAHRRSRLQGFIYHKREAIEEDINEALGTISEAIGKLHSILPLVREPSDKQADREKRKTRVFQGTSEAYTDFVQRLSTLQYLHSQTIRSKALEVLWRHIPHLPDLEDKAGNPQDPGDGLYYDQTHIAKAKSVLSDFHNAWLNAPALESLPPPTVIKESACICLILAGMQKGSLLEDFIDSGCTDADLRFEKEQLKQILRGDNVNYGHTFYAEQIRVSPREWLEGSHAYFEEEEPLPLVLAGPPVKGGFGIVVKVKDPLSGDTFVRKQQLVPSEERDIQACWEHLERETERLKRLDHRHVVQFVKSYQRGRAFGLVMRPAANGDLRSLLERFKADKFYARAGCSDSAWLRPHFHTAFGCLAEGLAYIHSRKIRHKDIKPGNILFQNPISTQGSSMDPARFIWADFGLAYDFSDSGDSKTKSTKIYSQRYAPPEVVANSRRAKSRERKRSVLASVDEVVAEGEVMVKAEYLSQASEDEIEAHGRAADIFGLGCVFLELLARLVKTELPLLENEEKTTMFADNIDRLCGWSTTQQQLEETRELRPLFSAASAMIRRRPEERLRIDQVVRAVMLAGEQFSCLLCRHEYDAQTPTMQKLAPTPAASPVVSPAASSAPSPAAFSSPRQSTSRPLLARVSSAMSSTVRSPRSSRMMSA